MSHFIWMFFHKKKNKIKKLQKHQHTNVGMKHRPNIILIKVYTVTVRLIG